MKEVSFLDVGENIICNLFDEIGLSVSSVKYSKGHDADCFTANLKIGTKIVGTVYDDSWGDYQYDGGEVKSFLSKLDSIMKLKPTFKSSDGKRDLDYDYDVLVQLLMEHTKQKRSCKNNVIVHISKKKLGENGFSNYGKQEFKYKSNYSNKMEEFIMGDFVEEEGLGFKYIEILNKRYL